MLNNLYKPDSVSCIQLRTRTSRTLRGTAPFSRITEWKSLILKRSPGKKVIYSLVRSCNNLKLVPSLYNNRLSVNCLLVHQYNYDKTGPVIVGTVQCLKSAVIIVQNIRISVSVGYEKYLSCKIYKKKRKKKLKMHKKRTTVILFSFIHRHLASLSENPTF